MMMVGSPVSCTDVKILAEEPAKSIQQVAAESCPVLLFLQLLMACRPCKEDMTESAEDEPTVNFIPGVA